MEFAWRVQDPCQIRLFAMSSSAISPRELAALSAARLPEEARGGSALILDLRSRRHQRRGRIPGSHSLPSGLLVSGEAPEGRAD